MGMFLFAALLAGALIGFVVTAPLGVVGIVVAARSAKTRPRAWAAFAVTALGAGLALGAIVYLAPYAPVRPGNDYDIAMRNLFIQGIAYCAIPGVAALAGSLASALSPRLARPRPA